MSMNAKKPMKPTDASRIQSTQVRDRTSYSSSDLADHRPMAMQAKGGKNVGKDTFASRGQSAAQNNANKGIVGGGTGGKSGGGGKSTGGDGLGKSIGGASGGGVRKVSK